MPCSRTSQRSGRRSCSHTIQPGLPTCAHFMLAGHTHGGQIRLPGIGIVHTATKEPRHWTHGLVEERGQYLYVTSGIGTSGLPLRWGLPPEIVGLDWIRRGNSRCNS